MAGAIAYGPHEGSRSEYLAQYVLAMFGTTVPVPHQEDHGIDLFCSLTQRKGRRAWPMAYYSVQVKSAGEPWLFKDADEVRWLLGYPSALLLCTVDKKTGLLCMYQLTARFHAAVRADPPKRLLLIPGQPGDGRTRLEWDHDGSLPLGAPVAEFTANDLLDDDQFSLTWQILRFWVQTDTDNIYSQQAGAINSASAPGVYTTNRLPPGAMSTLGISKVPPAARAATEAATVRQVDWLARVMLSDGDRLGALLSALMLRRLIPDGAPRTARDPAPEDLYTRLREDGRLDAALGTSNELQAAGPIEKLLAVLQDVLDGEATWDTT